MDEIRWRPVWFDSLGAKSSSVFLETGDTSVLIGPGAAVMHQSFPASEANKAKWLLKAEKAVREAAKEAKILVVSHYHYDHFVDFEKNLYENKTLFIKNPNEYVNDSQRGRAEAFFSHYSRAFGNAELEEIVENPVEKKYEHEPLDHALRRDYGDYSERKRELLERGRLWFEKRAAKWKNYEKIPEMSFGETRVFFPETKSFVFGKTRLSFSRPLFHGIEYAKTGWVFATIVERGKEKILHSSDLQGPVVEDQADWIIRQKPDILVLDGPSTYLIPYIMNMINLNRVVENMIRILEETKTRLIIYDHHLARDPRYKKRLSRVYETAEKLGKKVLTAAEYSGKTPKCLLGVS